MKRLYARLVLWLIRDAIRLSCQESMGRVLVNERDAAVRGIDAGLSTLQPSPSDSLDGGWLAFNKPPGA